MQEAPGELSALLPWAQRALFLSLSSLDKASRVGLSKGLLQLLILHKKRGIVTISPSSVSQILPPKPSTAAFQRPSQQEPPFPKPDMWLRKQQTFFSSELQPSWRKCHQQNPCTTQPCSKPVAEQGHLLCPFQLLISRILYN